MFKKNIHIWLVNYFFNRIKNLLYNSKTMPLHIIFTFVDHFEPHWGKVNDLKAKKRMLTWLHEYPEFATRFNDSYGNVLQHTWFYPYDEMNGWELEQLNKLCRQGLGEVEFHLHHKNDTEDSFRQKLIDGLKAFNQFGINVTVDNKIAYGFIHGNWALNNSVQTGNKNFCGVNDELRILRETGCFADFTFPAYMSPAQPKWVNTIYYAKSTPKKPKGHNKGILVKAGKPKQTEANELMIIEGPIGLNWSRRKWGIMPTIEDGNIHFGNPYHPTKVKLWLKMHIHVKGKPDWVFIKIYTHGASERNFDMVFGDDAQRLFTAIDHYFKRHGHKLHYVTAREMYNIIKAAEAGKNGDPEAYRDYLIKPYKNTKSK